MPKRCRSLATARGILSGMMLLIALIGLVPAGPATAAPQLVQIAGGLASPVYVTSARDGTGRLFIVERAGVIKVMRPGQAPTVFLDITSRVLSAGGEQGLLGLAFHPGFTTNRRFFVNYTRQTDGATVVAEYQVSTANPDVALSAERVILTVPQPFANHNGGMIEFGPDGKLYIALGDGGDGNDPGDRAQNLDDLLGKILRITVTDPGTSPAYTSPTDNPFVGVNGRDEIWAYGFRNPWRMSFDRGTGQLWAGDVGQDAIEEIDIVTRGGNYGWRTWEGTACTGLDGPCSSSGFIFPVTEYPQAGGRCSVTGGYVYRGTAAALPTGTYVFGDFCTGEILGLAGGTTSLLLDTTLNISSFGEDEQGEILVVALGGAIYRLTGGCSFSMQPASRSIPAGGGTDSVAVSTAAGCGWTAESSASWLQVTSGSPGSGPGTVSYTVAANTGTSPRSATITAGGQTHTVNQAGVAPTLSVSPASVAAGGSVTATWSSIAAPTPADWIGLYTTTAADTAFVSRIYVGCGAAPGASGVATGSCPFPIAGTVTPGTYQLRLFSNNGFTRLATSGNFTVTAPSATISISASPASVTLPGSVTATWSGIPQATASSTDWIGLSSPAAPNTSYRAWVYVSCSVTPTTARPSGSCAMTLPGNLPPGTYELRLFSKNGFTRLATSNTFAVVAAGAATLAVSPSSVVAGGSLTATWSNIPAPSSGDWIGLFTPGSANTAFLSRIFVGCGTAPSGSGAASGSCPFAVPGSVAPATYQLRLFASSGALLATSSNFTVTSPVVTTISASPSSVVAGGSLTATWSGIPAPSSGDWIGLFTPGSSNAAVLTRVFVGCGPNPSGSGAASGSCPFGVPGGTAPGSYQLRLFANSGALLATSSNFTVTAPVVTTLAASPASVVAGGSVTASWSGIASPTSGDWIGLYTPGSANSAFLARIFVGCGATPSGSGAASGSCPFAIAASVVPGSYQLRLFANNGFTLLATSNSFNVTAPAGATLSATPASVARGTAVTATWSGIGAATAGDWIGLFTPGASNQGYIAWRYVSCTQLMTVARPSGSCALGVPAGAAPGTYQIRLFTNNSYTVITTSNGFTVTP